MDGVGLAVDFDAQFVAGGVGAQVDAGGEKGAHKASGIVVAAEGFAGELHEGGFGAVGDELDGVDEVLSASTQLGDLLLGWEVFDLDVFRGGFALGFEGFELGLFGLEGQESGSFFFFVAGCGFGFVFLRAEGVGAKGGAGSTELGGGAAGLAVEGAPGGIDEKRGFRNGADSVFDEAVEPVVFAHVFEEVFLIPSGEHGGG